MNTTLPLSKIPDSDLKQKSHLAMADLMSSGEPPSGSPCLFCPICHKQLNNPNMLPCLHVFCLNCLRDECQGKTPDKFFCPSCVTGNDEGPPKSHQARTWHSFEMVLEQETGNEELQRRLAELPASETQTAETSPESWDKDSNDSSDTSGGGCDSDLNRKSSILDSPTLFPCSMHQDRLSDTFCLKCDQLACHKCVSSFHRRCQTFSDLKEAVDARRVQFDCIHDKMAANLVACEDVVNFQQKRLQEIDSTRNAILVEIKMFRTDLVNAILAKEKLLTQEANRILDGLQEEARGKHETAGKLARSLQRQMELLDLSFSAKGEGELLPLLPGLASRIDTDSTTIMNQRSDALSKLSFVPDTECKSVLDASALGQIKVDGVQNPQSDSTKEEGVQTGSAVESQQPDLELTLVTSFHGGTRDDITEPLLTDLIVIANGDVILTDRDNKCVKKFNQTGKLLTRVLLDAVPSRITTVSHARAVVSVMNKKSLYFLSLFGTVRVLHTVRVKKLYSFLTSLGNGLLAAGTNLCESIDVLNERGETLRSMFTQRHERASISRPLYLTPAIPRWATEKATEADNNAGRSKTSNNANNNNNNNNNSNNNNKININDVKTNGHLDANARRVSVNNISNDSSSNNNHNQTVANSSIGSSTTGSNASKKSNKKRHVSNSKKTDSSSSLTSSDKSPSPSSSSASSSSTTLSDLDILVSDSGKRVMFLLQEGGTVGFTLRSKDASFKLECPLGVTVHEKGLTLLVDRDSDSVLLLDRSGNFLKKVLTQSDGLSKPCGIYAGMKGGVALSQVDGTVKVYKTV